MGKRIVKIIEMRDDGLDLDEWEVTVVEAVKQGVFAFIERQVNKYDDQEQKEKWSKGGALIGFRFSEHRKLSLGINAPEVFDWSHMSQDPDWIRAIKDETKAGCYIYVETFDGEQCLSFAYEALVCDIADALDHKGVNNEFFLPGYDD